MKYKISVCIPVYNAEKYLEECLESLVNQTLKDIEIVCVNDGSTDGTAIILEKYKKKYKNIKIINQKNSGVIEARIKCIENANGEFIGWVDSDDFVEKDMFEKLYINAKKNKADVVICNYNFYPNKVINKKKWFNEYNGVVDWKFVSNNTLQWNKIVSKKLLDSLNVIDLLRNMGEGCYSLVLINAKNIITLNECLYNYRVGHSSLSSNFKNIDWFKTVIKKNLYKYNYVCSNNYDEKWQHFFKFVYLYYNLILLIVSAYNKNQEEYELVKKKILSEKGIWKNNKEYLKHYFGIKRMYFLKYIGIKSYKMTSFLSRILLK